MKLIYSSCLALFLFTVSLAQAQVPQRTTEYQACIETSKPMLTLELWDAGIEDNDSIRLYLNGKIVADSFRLSKSKQSIEVQLRPGANELYLYALNLGDIPSNTAAISVAGGDKISLSSGLEVNGAMQINLTGTAQTLVKVECPKNLKPLKDDNEAKLIRSNPNLVLPSYQLTQQGIRLNAGESFRSVEIQDCYNSSSKQVDLILWDCGVEDNDTVSLYLNGQWVLKNFRLTKAPFSLPVQLNNGENILVLYAHNLGDIPKNTAAVAVKNPYSEQEVGMMISDQNTCGAIRISYGMSDDFGNSVSPCLDENVVDSTTEPEVVYLNLQKPKTVSPSQQNTAPSNPPTTNPRRRNPPPVTRPVPPSKPRPVPPTPPSGTTPTPPKSPGGREPGDNPGGSGRNKPKPNY